MREELHKKVDKAPGENWQIYSLLGSLAILFFIALDVDPVISLLHWLDYTSLGAGYTTADVLISILQVTLIGFLGAALFSQGESYFSFITDEFDSKERAILAKFGLMTVIGIFGGLYLPRFLRERIEFVTLQTLGLVILAAYIVIHYEIVKWKLSNEKTILGTGLVLVFGPLMI